MGELKDTKEFDAWIEPEQVTTEKMPPVGNGFESGARVKDFGISGYSPHNYLLGPSCSFNPADDPLSFDVATDKAVRLSAPEGK